MKQGLERFGVNTGRKANGEAGFGLRPAVTYPKGSDLVALGAVDQQEVVFPSDGADSCVKTVAFEGLAKGVCGGIEDIGLVMPAFAVAVCNRYPRLPPANEGAIVSAVSSHEDSDEASGAITDQTPRIVLPRGCRHHQMARVFHTKNEWHGG